LKKFLAISITSPCCQSYGICGEQYSTDMQFGDESKLISSRLRVMHRPLRNSYDYIRAAR
jgi:Niemann-Pick C1 protein